MRNGVFVFLLVLLVAPLISSIGVANSYWDDNPLKLAPGETTTISLRLQNEEADQVTVEVSTISEIASLKNGSEYNVPTGKESVPVYLDVSIPENAEISDKYSVLVSFKQVASGEGDGFFQVAQGITAKIPVEVVGKQESELYNKPSETNFNMNLIYGVLILLLVIGVIFGLKNRRR